MEDIKEECNKIIEDESIDKKNALSMIKFKHSMELLLIDEIHKKDYEKLKLENEIEIMKRTSEKTEYIKDISKSVEHLTNYLQKLESNQNALSETIEGVCEMVEKLQQNFEKKTSSLEDKYNIIKNALESMNDQTSDRQSNKKKS